MNTFVDMTKEIPHGSHCYDEKGVCSAWGIAPNMPAQENGYCTYTLVKDWIPSKFQGIPLLWDQVKCCGINEEEGNDGNNLD